MRIKILLATIFCLLSCLVFGQASPYKKIADSLEKRLPFAKNDTSKVKLLNNASMNFAYTYENEKSFRYASEALALARRLKWKKGIVHAYKHIGLSYEIQSDQKTANEYVLKAFNVALETNDNLLKGEMYEAMGVSQWNINLEVSMKYFDKAMKFYKAAGYIAGYNSVLLQKGGTYSNQGKYYEAADCFREVMKNGEKAKDTGQAITGSNYLAGVYSELGNDVKALEYYLKALDLLERLKNEGVFTAL
ncbi:MAG: tetratricopeptide repeat protein, partial [Flavobacterium sp.]